MRTLCLGLMLVALGACGGRAIEEPNPESAGSTSSPVGDPAPSAGASSNPSDHSGSGSLPKHDLGECKPGFVQAQYPARACPWLIENGQCFETQDAACACICNSASNVCWSGFPTPGVPTLLHCD